jgi:hypothetical protein
MGRTSPKHFHFTLIFILVLFFQHSASHTLPVKRDCFLQSSQDRTIVWRPISLTPMRRPCPAGVTAHGGPNGPLQFDRLWKPPLAAVLQPYLPAIFALLTFPS